MSGLELDRVTIARGGRIVLGDLTLRFDAGCFTAVIGANGIGKSSLLATLCGTVPPARGRVSLDGRALAGMPPRERARAIAFVEPTEAVLGVLTVAEAVAAARFPFHRWWEWQATRADTDAVDEALAATALTALRERELATLSAGERQRVWLALALAGRARIIALDEPTSHLDLRYALETLAHLQRLARGGATVIAVLHAIDEAAAFADDVIVLGDGGVIARGRPADVLTAATLRAAYGVDVTVVRDELGGIAFQRNARGLETGVPRPRQNT